MLVEICEKPFAGQEEIITENVNVFYTTVQCEKHNFFVALSQFLKGILLFICSELPIDKNLFLKGSFVNVNFRSVFHDSFRIKLRTYNV